MNAAYLQPEVALDAGGHMVRAEFEVRNDSASAWREADGFAVGWRGFDGGADRFSPGLRRGSRTVCARCKLRNDSAAVRHEADGLRGGGIGDRWLYT